MLHQLAAVDAPEDSAATLSAFHDVGAGTVIVVPDLDQAEAQITRLARDVVPLVR